MREGIVALALMTASAANISRPAVSFDWFEYRGDDRLPQPRADEYANPVIQGFYPDPSVVRVGGDYYLVNSSFAWFAGIPVWRSRDLVNWTQIENAIDRPSQLQLRGMGMGEGVFAPDISWQGGRFYVVNTCVGCGGNFVITARAAAGPWSDPVWLRGIDGIDPSLFFDDDGSAWILNNGPPEGTPRYDGHRAIWIQQFDPKRLKPFGPRRVLVDGGVCPLFLASCATPQHPQSLEVALTLDDLPVHGPIPAGDTPQSVANGVIAALTDARVPAYGFVNAHWTAEPPETLAVLQAWRAAGLSLANHGWDHRWLKEMSPAEFEQELVKNEPVLERLGAGSDWRWFRYPFLDAGSGTADPCSRARNRSPRQYWPPVELRTTIVLSSLSPRQEPASRFT